jgi:outer membrane protein TolC
MRAKQGLWGRIQTVTLAALVSPALAAGAAGPGQESLPAPGAPQAPAPLPTQPQGPLSLEACKQLALEHEPSLAAARASLAAAAARAQAVENLHVPRFLARDLPVRRCQAALGVSAAQAGVTRAEADVLYGVTYSYLSALYALEQSRVARGADQNLADLQQTTKELLPQRRNLRESDVTKIGAYREVVAGRQEEAQAGLERALSSLREALALGPDCPLALAGSSLPRINPPVDREQALAAALARRPEILQASLFAQVTEKEVCAQDALHSVTGRTFAQTSDIHAQPVPVGSYDENYRPGAVGPEMPTALPGSRCDRVSQARAYNARAEAAAEKARNLVALETEQAYLRWKEAAGKLPHYEKAAEDAARVAGELQKEFKLKETVNVDAALNAGLVATQLRVQVNQTRYQLLLALAALERATGGGFCAGFETPAPAALPAEVKQEETNGTREGTR